MPAGFPPLQNFVGSSEMLTYEKPVVGRPNTRISYLEGALRFQNILEFRPIVSAMRSRAMLDLTAYLKYKTRALICGGMEFDEISDNAGLIRR